jgi:hypothetical protein
MIEIANTVAQVEQFLGDLYNLSAAPLRDNMEDIRSETQQAIAAVLNGERWVDLPPGLSLVRRLQYEMAQCGVGFSFVWSGTKEACEDI